MVFACGGGVGSRGSHGGLPEKTKCGGGYLDVMIVLYLYSPESNSIDILRSPITNFDTGQGIHRRRFERPAVKNRSR